MKKKSLRSVNWTRYLPIPVIGVDEVGRGCLAGPVVAAAVVLAKATRRKNYFDSKTLSEVRREKLSLHIQERHQWCIGIASVEEIDQLNIFHASLLAMRRAVEGLKVDGGHILIDGKFKIPGLLSFEQTPLVQGDSRAEPISAASIVAKVARDLLMKELAERFPGYGFEVHKGYATAAHRARLAELGPCEHHRRSFAGIGAMGGESDGEARLDEALS